MGVVNIQFKLYTDYNGMYSIPKLLCETAGPFYSMTQHSYDKNVSTQEMYMRNTIYGAFYMTYVWNCLMNIPILK